MERSFVARKNDALRQYVYLVLRGALVIKKPPIIQVRLVPHPAKQVNFVALGLRLEKQLPDQRKLLDKDPEGGGAKTGDPDVHIIVIKIGTSCLRARRALGEPLAPNTFDLDLFITIF